MLRLFRRCGKKKFTRKRAKPARSEPQASEVHSGLPQASEVQKAR